LFVFDNRAEIIISCLSGYDETRSGCSETRSGYREMMDVSMHQMIIAERENIQFLSGSLSELSRAHALELLKLESSRRHCEELAVELNDRLTQKEAEIVQLRHLLDQATITNILHRKSTQVKDVCKPEPSYLETSLETHGLLSDPDPHTTPSQTLARSKIKAAGVADGGESGMEESGGDMAQLDARADPRGNYENMLTFPGSDACRHMQECRHMHASEGTAKHISSPQQRIKEQLFEAIDVAEKIFEAM
jgi:hypothetical protein